MFERAFLFCRVPEVQAPVEWFKTLFFVLEIISDPGNLAIDDSRISEGCPSIRLM